MIKKFITTAVILASSTACVCFAQGPDKNIIKTPVSTFNQENLKVIKNNELTNDFLRIITFSQNSNTQNTATIDYSKKYADANEKQKTLLTLALHTNLQT